MMCVFALSFVFFFNETATTEIYTYWTHSFPTRRSSDLYAVAAARGRVFVTDYGFYGGQSTHRVSVIGAARGQVIDTRSEEHTSELQSLMRISYAVFCLKKKKKQKQTQHTPDEHYVKRRQTTQHNNTTPVHRESNR